MTRQLSRMFISGSLMRNHILSFCEKDINWIISNILKNGFKSGNYYVNINLYFCATRLQENV